MPLKRPLLFIPAAIALAALAAFLVLWIGAHTQLARRLVAGWIMGQTGLPATVASLRIGLSPSPALEVGGLAIAQPPGFGDAPLVEVGRARLVLPWGSVFGAARLDGISVADATVRLAVGADGVANWSKLLRGGETDRTAAAGRPSWFLGALDIEGGTIDYRGEAAGSSWQLTAITLTARDVAPGAEFPLELRLGGIFGPNTIHYAMKGRGRLDLVAGRYEASALDFRGWAGGEPLPLAGVELTGALKHATYESGSGVATLEAGRFDLGGIPGTFEARLDLDGPGAGTAVRLETEPFGPRAPAIIFGHPLPATADPTAFESLQLVLQARVQDGVLQIDPVSGRFDDTNFEGRLVPGRRLVRANLDRIDLNRYLPPAVKSASGKKATLEAAVAELSDFDLDAEIRIAEARVAGAKIHDALIRVERSGGPAQ